MTVIDVETGERYPVREGSHVWSLFKDQPVGTRIDIADITYELVHK